LFKNNQCSPRTYHARREQIDKWVHIERLEIEKTKVTFQQEWDKTVKMIEDTQKSVDEIRSKI
jgi:hydroxymethylglutaryl-CoA reductase